ncbi:MAG TPA: FlgD immunoglobulin-like domain containing protein, partial [Candidatus Krumholzibacteria bacterium]|nr:FlgD immunoglobulin-like domain containing protein [Candidatus Krumholzibacteria bacterium]
MLRIATLCLGLAVLTTGAAAVEFVDPVFIAERHCVDSARFGDDSLILTTSGLWLVDWSQPAGLRDRLVIDRPLRDHPFAAWGDSLVAMAPYGQGGHLVIHRGPDGEPVIAEIADPDWHPADVWLGGRPWWLEVGYGGDFLLHPALDATGPDLTMPGSATFDPRLKAFAGSVFITGRTYDPEWHGAVIQAWDMADPEHPVVGATVKVSDGWDLIELAGHGDVVYCSASLLEAWDVSDVMNPVHVTTIGPGGGNQYLEVGPGDRLSAILNRSIARVLDISNPALPRNLVLQSLTDPYPYPRGIDLESDRVLVRQSEGTRGLQLPAIQGRPVREIGWTWPILGDPRGLRAATDGRFVWIQHGQRLVADLEAGTLVASPEAEVADDGSAAAFLAWRHGYLLSVPGDGRLVCEDVADALQPTVAWTFEPPLPISRSAIAGDLLAVQTGTTVVVFDVSNPAQMRVRCGVALVASDDTRWTLCGPSLVMMQEFTDETISPQTWQHVLRVFDVGSAGSVPEIAVADVVVWDDLWNLAGMIATGHQACAYGWFETSLGNSPRGVPIDLADPAAPVIGDQAIVNRFATDKDLATLDTPLGLCLLNLRDDSLNASLDEGTLPTEATVLAQEPTPGALCLAAPVLGRVAVATYLGVHGFTLDGLGLSDAGPPAVAAAPGVIASPNPFNPKTLLSFGVERAGPVRVEIFDVAGRRVRRLDLQLPAGPAAVPWLGNDDGGRALPSGVYLVRMQAGERAQA